MKDNKTPNRQSVTKAQSKLSAVPETPTIKCPGCDLQLPEDDLNAQVQHMEQFHPEIIGERHRKVGIRSEFTEHPRKRLHEEIIMTDGGEAIGTTPFQVL